MEMEDPCYANVGHEWTVSRSQATEYSMEDDTRSVVGTINSTTDRMNASTPDLLGIPVEIRNLIYEHALEPTDSAVDITSKPPDIMQVCSQIRHEAQRVYLAATDFKVHVGEEDDPEKRQKDLPCGYVCLLEHLDRLGPEYVGRIKSLTVICHETKMITLPATEHATVYYTMFALLNKWNELERELLKRGLQIHQIKGLEECKTYEPDVPFSMSPFRPAFVYRRPSLGQPPYFADPGTQSVVESAEDQKDDIRTRMRHSASEDNIECWKPASW